GQRRQGGGADGKGGRLRRSRLARICRRGRGQAERPEEIRGGRGGGPRKLLGIRARRGRGADELAFARLAQFQGEEETLVSAAGGAGDHEVRDEIAAGAHGAVAGAALRKVGKQGVDLVAADESRSGQRFLRGAPNAVGEGSGIR